MNGKFFRLTLFASAITLAMAGSANAQSYVFTDLGEGAALALNDLGQVAGYGLDGHAVVWNGTTETVLDKVGYSNYAAGINKAGQVVGTYDASCGCDPHLHALYWDNSGASGAVLITKNKTSSVGTGISSQGVEVGYQYAAGDKDDSRAVIWVGTKSIELGTKGKHTSSVATAINDVGQEVGYFSRAGSKQAVLWDGITPTILTSLGKHSSSQATAVNNNGEIVGFANDPGRGWEAVVWTSPKKKPTVLEGIGGATSASFALGLNNEGEIVGYSVEAGTHTKKATLWNNGKVVNLNDYLTASERAAGWVLAEATAINNNGEIVGYEENTITGKTNAFALNTIAAVPEPTTYSMLLMGLGFVGFMARRRKSVG